MGIGLVPFAVVVVDGVRESPGAVGFEGSLAWCAACRVREEGGGGGAGKG